MSRVYWYGQVKDMCKRYPIECSCIQELMYQSAIEQTIEEFRQQDNGDTKLKVIKMVLFDKTDTILGAAVKVNYSIDTIYPWISEFVKKVGQRAGFNI